MNSGIKPHTVSHLEIPGCSDLPKEKGETYLELVFTLKDATNWAAAGHEVAFGQLQLTTPATLSTLKSLSASTGPKYTQISPQILEITSSTGTTWKFNIIHGSLASWKTSSGEELLHTAPILDFHRAFTDNDTGEFAQSWKWGRLSQAKTHVRSVSWNASEDSLIITVQARIAPPVLEWAVHTTFTYTFTDKHLSIKVKGTPSGSTLPNTFARIGLTFSLNNINSATWFGRGPGGSYSDKKLSQKYGTYDLPIADLFTDYEFPQESGNRTDVRWVEFKSAKGGLKATFGDLPGASFAASHYRMEDVQECGHPYELRKRAREETVVRLDWAHHGLGTGSCGPVTMEEYVLRSGEFEYEVLLE